jgi:putative tricarboxylic transport membrane protein
MTRMKKADQWSGLALSILAAGMICAALGLPYGNVHNPGPGFFPLWLGVILGGMSIALLVQTIRGKESERTLRDILEEDVRWGKVLLVLAGLVLYGFLMDYLGFFIVTFLLMALLLRFIEPQPWKIVIGWALSGSVGSYLIFEVWMKLRLPKGFLGI